MLKEVYFNTLHFDVGDPGLLHLINDGLLISFFLLVGFGINREMLVGQLSDWPRHALPDVAAVGGMVVPVNRRRPGTPLAPQKIKDFECRSEWDPLANSQPASGRAAKSAAADLAATV